MEVDGAGEPGVAAEPGPSQTLYVHNLSERVRKEGACSGSQAATLKPSRPACAERRSGSRGARHAATQS